MGRTILLLKYFSGKDPIISVALFFFEAQIFLNGYIINIIAAIVRILTPTLNSTMFPGCYYSPSVKLDSTTSATKGYIIKLPLGQEKRSS